MAPDGINMTETIYALFRLGWSAALIVTAEHKCGKPSYPSSHEIKSILGGHKAVIGYLDPKVRDHALAWDGNEAIDCSTGTLVALESIVITDVLILTCLTN